MGETQVAYLREKIQEKIQDKKVQSIFFIGREIGDVLIYGLNNNSGHIFAIAKVHPDFRIEVIR